MKDEDSLWRKTPDASLEEKEMAWNRVAVLTNLDGNCVHYLRTIFFITAALYAKYQEFVSK